jgi:hypothetical protein
MYPSSSIRNSLQTSQAAGLGLLTVEPIAQGGSQADSVLIIGLIGCERRIPDNAYFGQNKFAEVVALCDI